MRWHLIIAIIFIALCIIINVAATIKIAIDVNELREIIQLQAERLE